MAVGTAQVTVVSDGAFQLSPAYPTLAVNGTRENVERALRREFLSPEGVPTHVNALLVRTGTDTVLVDAGCGPLFGPTTGHLIENLARAGTRPDEITAVLLTHLHGDHIGGLLDEAGRSRFPKAELLLHADEHAFWSAEDPDLSASALPAERRAGMVRAAKRLLGAARFTLLRGAAQVRPGIVLVPAPGHTPGHCGLLIDGGGDNQLLSITDAIHNAAIQLAHPEYYVAFDTAPEQAVEARKRLLDRAAAERVLVTGAHLPFPAIGHVRRRDEESREAGAAYEWVPEVWRWHA
ncbi:MAG TPA: MBL fold metallo-hydrolase [Phycisphaerales bacterium]|nr:MBL fold metallo-hydrolase [Phycisphaerales bacterium]